MNAQHPLWTEVMPWKTVGQNPMWETKNNFFHVIAAKGASASFWIKVFTGLYPDSDPLLENVIPL